MDHEELLSFLFFVTEDRVVADPLVTLLVLVQAEAKHISVLVFNADFIDCLLFH